MIGVAPRKPKNEIILPYPHQGQQVVRREARRHNWLSAGRRWRKTTLVMAVAVEAATSRKQIIWGAPTFDQVRIGWEETRKAAGNVAVFNQSQMTATFPGGGRILYRSLDDPDNARGHTADGVVIDEASEVKAVAWYEVMRPMLLDTGGWSWCMGTPKGCNWFWQEWIRAADDADARSWQAPTLGCRITPEGLVRAPHPLENPDISFAEMLKLYATMPERTFRQEILAEFIEDSGGVFRRVSDAATATRQDKPVPGHTYSLGIDWGKHQDFTVLAVLDMTTKEIVHVDRFNQIDYALQRARVRALADTFRPRPIIAERNAMGEPIIEALEREGLRIEPFTTTNASKAELIEALALAFERGDIRIIPEPTLIAELQAYEAERLPSGMLRYSAPEGLHDDCVIALALAWQAVAIPPGRVTISKNPFY